MRVKRASAEYCSVDGCDRIANLGLSEKRRAIPWCNLHRQRFAKTGDPLGQRGTRHLSVVERTWAKIDTSPGPDVCWPWGGKCNDQGYGIVWGDGGQRLRAHRVVYMDIFGPVGDDVEIRHRCDWPPCCNPLDLEPGSHADNMRDMSVRGRRRQYPDSVIDAVISATGGPTAVAREHGVSPAYVHLLRTGWRPGDYRLNA